MRLESAMYASREGLSAHGQAISVIGDNIANANTVAYKTSRVEFADLLPMGQGSLQSPPQAVLNGSGVKVSRVRQNFETGIIEPTGRALDVAIDGDGFFIVGAADNQRYSRAGNFSLGSDGILKDSNGLDVLGFQAGSTELAPLNLQEIQLEATPTTEVVLNGNLSADEEIVEVLANPQSFREIGQAASYVSNFDVYDSLGALHTVTMAFYKTGPNAWTAQAYMDAGELGGEAGTPELVGDALPITFGEDGRIAEADQANLLMTVNAAYGNGAAAGNFTVNLGGFTQFAAPNQPSSLTQNGQAAGNVSQYEFLNNGEIYAQLDTGQTILVGTIQLATFANVDGLARAGNNLFTATADAGDAVTGSPGSGSFGTVSNFALERSSVDIATEFIDLLLYQRGYQANSQALTTSSDLLRETIGLMR